MATILLAQKSFSEQSHCIDDQDGSDSGLLSAPVPGHSPPSCPAPSAFMRCSFELTALSNGAVLSGLEPLDLSAIDAETVPEPSLENSHDRRSPDFQVRGADAHGRVNPVLVFDKKVG
jgi:hypothetical protein